MIQKPVAMVTGRGVSHTTVTYKYSATSLAKITKPTRKHGTSLHYCGAGRWAVGGAKIKA